jgi:hypothetical protein
LKDATGKPIVGSMVEALRNADEAVVTYFYPKAVGTEPCRSSPSSRSSRPGT